MYQSHDKHSQRLTGSLLVHLDPHVRRLLLFFLTPKQVLLIYLLPVLLEMLLAAPMCLMGTTHCLQRVLPFSNPLVIQKTQTQLSIQPEGAALMSQDYQVVMEAQGEH